MLSDFIYAQTLVLSFSALGIYLSWLTDESTTIIAPSHLKDTPRFQYSKSFYDAQQKKLRKKKNTKQWSDSFEHQNKTTKFL